MNLKKQFRRDISARYEYGLLLATGDGLPLNKSLAAPSFKSSAD
jgi:hypothetical protein